MLKILVVLRSGGEYKPEHVYAIERMCSEYIKEVDYEFHCISDIPLACSVIPMRHGWARWWGKMELFLQEGPCLFFDLDTIICGNLDGLIKNLLKEATFAALKDDKRKQFGSGIMFWNGNYKHIYDIFAAKPKRLSSRFRGDQDFITQVVTLAKGRYIQSFSEGIISWQRGLRHGKLYNPDKHKIVFFYGKCRPWRQDVIPYRKYLDYKKTITMVKAPQVSTGGISLPAGYRIASYSIGDIDNWVKIVNQSDSYNDITHETFFSEFGSEFNVLGKMFFIVSPEGHYVATGTAWIEQTPRPDILTGEWGRVHWLSVLPDYRRKGLARILLRKIISKLNNIPIYLDGRSERKNAFLLYSDEGFVELDNSKGVKRAVILAAGMGTRMGGKVKCLLEVGGETLLERMIRQFSDRGVFDVSVVVGYDRRAIQNKLNGRAVRVVVNTEYDTTDNAHSLFLYLHKFGSSLKTIVADAEMYFEDGAVSRLINTPCNESSTLVDIDNTTPDSMKVVLSDNGYVSRFSKSKGIGSNVLPALDSRMLEKLHDSLEGGDIKHWITSEFCGNIKPIKVERSDYFEVDTKEEYDFLLGVKSSYASEKT